jgi:hypothetical protein
MMMMVLLGRCVGLGLSKGAGPVGRVTSWGIAIAIVRRFGAAGAITAEVDGAKGWEDGWGMGTSCSVDYVRLAFTQWSWQAASLRGKVVELNSSCEEINVGCCRYSTRLGRSLAPYISLART